VFLQKKKKKKKNTPPKQRGWDFVYCQLCTTRVEPPWISECG